MEGRVKQVVTGLIFVLSVSAVSGAVTYSQMRRGDDPPGRKESKSEAAPPLTVRRSADSTGEADATKDRPRKSDENAGDSEPGIGEALGFGADAAAASQGNGNHPGHGRGRGHEHHGNGHGHGHEHHDHDNPPPVSPAHPGHNRGHGHDHGRGGGHDHHQHD